MQDERKDLLAWRRRNEQRKGSRAQPIPGKRVEDEMDEYLRAGLGDWEDRG